MYRLSVRRTVVEVSLRHAGRREVVTHWDLGRHCLFMCFLIMYSERMHSMRAAKEEQAHPLNVIVRVIIGCNYSEGYPLSLSYSSARTEGEYWRSLLGMRNLPQCVPMSALFWEMLESRQLINISMNTTNTLALISRNE